MDASASQQLTMSSATRGPIEAPVTMHATSLRTADVPIWATEG